MEQPPAAEQVVISSSAAQVVNVFDGLESSDEDSSPGLAPRKFSDSDSSGECENFKGMGLTQEGHLKKKPKTLSDANKALDAFLNETIQEQSTDEDEEEKKSTTKTAAAKKNRWLDSDSDSDF